MDIINFCLNLAINLVLFFHIPTSFFTHVPTTTMPNHSYNRPPPVVSSWMAGYTAPLKLFLKSRLVLIFPLYS